MRRPSLLCLALLLAPTTSRISAQQQIAQVSPALARDTTPFDLHDYLERGYITMPAPISVGNAPKVWFEGSIVPHFALFKTHRAAVVVTPKVVVRMLQDGISVPVRTPSYMPR